MSTAEELNTAADLIKRDGWVIGGGGWTNAGGRGWCVEGALIQASSRPDMLHHDSTCLVYEEEVENLPACQALLDYLGLVDRAYQPLYLWNDHSSEEEVIASLRAAALIEAAKQEVLVEC